MPTYASQATIGYLGTFSIGSPLTQLTEVVSINFPRYAVPEIGKTHLLSPNATEELMPGLLKPGKISMTGNYLGDTAQASIDTLAQNQSTVPYQITFKVQNGTKTATITGLGYVAKMDIGPVEGEKKLDYAMDFQTTGFSTINVA